jgi:NAD(P)-dependent dehydrogenase (short-subunit alcohol dehydrogenase family)
MQVAGPEGMSHSQSQPQIQSEPKKMPAQTLKGTGEESKLTLKPRFEAPRYKSAGKLEGKRAIISGGDSGIGRAVAVLFAREGADVAILYFSHDGDAQETKRLVEAEGRKCLLFKGDIADWEFVRRSVNTATERLGGLDIVVPNAAFQKRSPSIEELSLEDFDRTIKTNVYGYFHLVKAAVPHLKPGAAIVATGSETGLFGNKLLLDYSMTKGAIHMLVKSLASNLVERGIRVNAVAPGPIWTPLNPADKGQSADRIAEFGQQTEMKRPGQPEEMAPAYVFLASDADSSFITGQIIPALGGATG